MATSRDKKSFCLFIDQMQRVRKLPDNDRLNVFDALIDSETARHNGTKYNMPFSEVSLAGYAFSEIAASLDRNAAEYDRISEERAKSGQRGGIRSGEARRAKQNEANEANASIAKQNEAKRSKRSDIDKDTDTEIDIVMILK